MIIMILIGNKNATQKKKRNKIIWVKGEIFKSKKTD